MTVDMIPREKMVEVGKRPARFDGKSKVTGQALYATDISLPGLLHGRVLRSPHAHATIRAIDTSKAEALPGVFAIVTANDLPEAEDRTDKLGESTVNFKFLRDNNLASDKVLYVGHAIAAVAASTPNIAEQALDLIEVDYEVLPAVVDVRNAMTDDAAVLHNEIKTTSPDGDSDTASNVASHFRHLKGDPEKGFAEADVIVEREFNTVPVHQSYLEPHAATATWGADGQLTVYASTQGIFAARQQVSTLLQYPMSKIKVIPTECGGGFGGKNPTYVETPAALLSRKTGRPVRVVMSRKEVILGTGPGPGTSIKVKVGATKDGKITAAQADLAYEAGAYPGSAVGAGAMAMFAGYDIPHGQIDGYDVLVNKPRSAAYRAPGAPQSTFASEQVMDEIAQKIGMDAVEFRQKNVAREGTERIDGPTHKSIAVEEMLGIIEDHPHYNDPLEGPNQGRGVAIGFWGNWGARSSAAINVNSDGTVSLISGSVDLTGSRTSLAMQAADILEIPLESFTASMADSDSISYTDTTGGSRTTMATGIAAVEAARDVIAKMTAEAAKAWEVSEDSISYAKGVFSSREKSGEKMTFAELAGKLSAPLTGQGNINATDWAGAFGAHIVDVEVDPETGLIKILRYTAIQNAGKAIHPGHVEGQMQGGVVQGIGWALYEGYEYDQNGQVLNANLLDYKLPTALDVPPIEAVIVEKPYPGNPYGVRGVGETPIVPPAAAIANAVEQAIGKRVTQLPITPARVLETMGVI
ncbi:MAG: xanthine dehydrogenase family protein molybdopterin-binding subunit [Chloroflexota bacterium]